MVNDYLANTQQLSTVKNTLYQKVIVWVGVQFAVMAVGTYVFGPLVPPSMVMPLYILLLVSMLFAAFSRKFVIFAPILAIVVPFVLGITLYGTLNNLLASGSGNIIVSAAIGTAIIFTIMAVWGYTSSKSLNSIASKVFAVLLGIIAISLLNYFVFQIPVLSLLISMAVVVVFSIYIFIDIQSIRDDIHEDTPASIHALNIFLNIYNIFVALLNILSFFDD